MFENIRIYLGVGSLGGLEPLTEEQKDIRDERARAYEAEQEAKRQIGAKENLAFIRETKAFLEAYKANPEGYPLLTPSVLEALTDWRGDYDTVISRAVYTDNYELYETQADEYDELDDLINELIPEDTPEEQTTDNQEEGPEMTTTANETVEVTLEVEPDADPETLRKNLIKAVDEYLNR